MTRARCIRVALLGAALSVPLAASSDARAGEPVPADPGPVEAAAPSVASLARDRLLAEGKKLLSEGRIDEACARFRAGVEAQRDSEALTASGQCLELQGKTASAWAAYTEAMTAASREGARDREDRARSLAGQLAPRLSKLRIDVQSPREGQTVLRDGVALDRTAWGALVPVDPGPHAITSAAPGMAPFSVVVKLAGESDVRIVLIPALSAPGKNAPRPTPGDQQPGETSSVVRRTSPIGVAAFVTTSFGLLGLTLGTVFGVMALNEASGAEDDPLLCPDKVCSPAGTAVIDEARTKGVVSTVTLSVGGASLATGIVLFLVRELAGLEPEEPAKPGAPKVTPVVGFGQLGVQIAY